MSLGYYLNWWIATRKQMELVFQKDQKFRDKAKPIKTRKMANKLLGGLYIKYCLLVQAMDTCLDQIAQPQKRKTIKKLVDAATIRLRELSEELRDIDISEYHYVDGELIELKILPYDIEIIHPSLMYPRPIDIEDMWKKLKQGEKIYIPPPPPPPPPPEEGEEGEGEEGKAESPEGAEPKEGEEAEKTEESEGQEKTEEGETQVEAERGQKKPKKEKPKEAPVFKFEKELTPEELEEKRKRDFLTKNVTLIQSAERGRQERLYFSQKFSVAMLCKMLIDDPTIKPRPPPSPEVGNPAACTIQKVWKGHSVRERLKYKERQRRLLIGMDQPSWRSKEEFEKFERNLNKRREYRDQRIREYVEAIDKEKARIVRVVAPGLMEDIGEEIREWFRFFHRRIKLFPPFPTEEEGGTVLVVRGETMTPEQYLLELEKKKKEKGKKENKKAERAKLKKAKLKEKAMEKKRKELEKKMKEIAMAQRRAMLEKGEYEFEYVDTKCTPLYEEGMKELRDIWDPISDFDNPLEKHYLDMIIEQECYENQLEVRKNVDELMRVELELLEYALEYDKMREKGKKGKPRRKKTKPPKKKKEKKPKDPTFDRTTEDLFQELYEKGIIRTYPTVRLDDYQGDFSYKNFDLRTAEYDPPSTLLDIRQVVVMNCIMPLGVEAMKKPKSVLIAGPRQTGKHLLANAIFTETKCVLFDLSPENTKGKYKGKKGLKMLVHLVNKMSRILAPSIIYFSAAEKIFYKKVPKEERKLDPKRIGKDLFKGIVKPILPEDRVLVLGITNQPWMAQAGKMKKAFERNILLPRPDYSSISKYLRNLLMSYHGVDRNFNVTALATVVLYYPLPEIKRAVETVLTPRRIVQLKYKPLEPAEIYEVFVSEMIEPITEDEYSKFQKWYDKFPLGRDRIKFNKNAEIKREAEKKKKEKGSSQ